jgi:hypothetical protein
MGGSLEEEEERKFVGYWEKVVRDTGRKLGGILGGSWERGYWEEVWQTKEEVGRIGISKMSGGMGMILGGIW